MTTILYDGRGALHGDRQRGQHRHQGTKVCRMKNGGLLGTSGSTGECLRLERFLAEHCHRDPLHWPDLPKSVDGLMAIYVHPDRRVFLIDTIGFPIPMDIDRPLAIGSGGDVALGAFVASGDAMLAMEVAHRFDTCTGAEFDCVQLAAERSPYE